MFNYYDKNDLVYKFDCSLLINLSNICSVIYLKDKTKYLDYDNTLNSGKYEGADSING